MQGVGYLKRTAIASISVTLEPKRYFDDANVEHIDVKQTLSGGFKAPADNLVLDGKDYPRDDDLFGSVVVTARRITVDELEINRLKEDWTEDTLENGLVYCVVKSDTEKTKKDWVIHLVCSIVQPGKRMHLMSSFQVWGFVIIDGVRRFSRRYKLTTKERPEPIYVKLHYDYCGYLAFSSSNPD